MGAEEYTWKTSTNKVDKPYAKQVEMAWKSRKQGISQKAVQA